MRLILLGAPGAGKGTQAEVLSQKFAIPAISTGNIIREAINRGTPLGIQARSYIEQGDLVPDEVVIDIVRERLSEKDCGNGFILDGFPRTIPQAAALDALGFCADIVINIELPDEKIIERLSGRRVCLKCGATYHILYNPPATPDVCTKCGDQLVQREDDHPETVLARLKVYHKQTEPLKEYYAKSGKLRIVQGQDEVAQTTALTLKVLEDYA